MRFCFMLALFFSVIFVLSLASSDSYGLHRVVSFEPKTDYSFGWRAFYVNTTSTNLQISFLMAQSEGVCFLVRVDSYGVPSVCNIFNDGAGWYVQYSCNGLDFVYCGISCLLSS